ncbi:hypothetical protein [Phaeocystidibacter marisrubri]|uniref:DUF4412 domain-containing protein n=1 Tax=Phaeocystidibacter marisrubri TaxID=1577780 RepID=A0A6L3ZDD8_9FLAO|nr:hypothetical protein [Phaeocystidibacter marisrubri]KAB2815248.1 hypothetical protein F8C82_14235 [Phaeocystidibacter marisrubri]GGH71106.1 hypothetical protein GCM10011318_13790 [Phaeocystidibacter marisrubri]
MKFKHILPVFAALALVSCGAFKSSEPKPVVGKITYSMKVESVDGQDNPMIEAMQQFLPSRVEQASNGVDYAMRMDGMQAMHIVAKSADSMVYVAAGGEFIKTSISNLNNQADSEQGEIETVVEELGDTKEVLGMTCKGYRVTAGETVSTLYVNSDFTLNSPSGMPNMMNGAQATGNVEGTPLYVEVIMNQGGQEFKMIMEATEFVEGEEAIKDILTPSKGEYVYQEEM